MNCGSMLLQKSLQLITRWGLIKSILNHPEKQVITREAERFGKIVDIFAPGIGGARYTANGEFIGFLEP
jgi:filamentous hemagglutinin